MEDEVFQHNKRGGITVTTLKSTTTLNCDDEPQRKKRCIRFPSDLSSEDPLLVSDSGFEDFSASAPQDTNQHGDHGPFFRLTSPPQLYEGTVHPLCGSARTTSIDTLSLHTVLSDVPDTEGDIVNDDEDKSENDETNANGTLNSDTSDPSSSGNISESYSACENRSSSEEENTWDSIFKSKEIANSPSRTLIMQRFLSHLRSNPNDSQLQHFLSLMLSGPEFSQPRQRLRHVTTMADVTRLFRCSKKILVLTGAGISVSCGIPDFRSKDGLYARVSKVFPHLRDPQSVFDIRLFRRDPRPFFLTAKELYPGQFETSLSHKFIRKLETRGQLLRNYSQNIDTLETIAGINKVTMCHGCFGTATCIRCKHRVQADDIKEKVLAGEVPFCPNCSTPEETNQIKFPLEPQVPNPSQIGSQRRGSFDDNEEDDDDEMYPSTGESFPIPPVLKPDIVFFGEDLPDEFHHNLELDKPECDLLLVIGSSLRVRPVSLIPGMLPPGVPQILINRESLGHCRFDIELLGNCDTIISQLCRSLGPDFKDLAAKSDLMELDKISRGDICGPVEVDLGIPLVPQSENDIQALKECWKPKINENIAERLPESSYLSWRPRQYVFEGAEVLFDPDDDEDDDDSSGSDSDSSISSTEAQENEAEVLQNSTKPRIVVGQELDSGKPVVKKQENSD